MQDMTMYENLANAVVIRAAKDYKWALRMLKKHPNHEKAADRKKEVEEFFHSGWFEFLTNADGDYLLDRLRMEG